MTARQEFIEDAIQEFFARVEEQPVVTIVLLEEYATEINNKWANNCTDKQFDRALIEVQRGVYDKLSAKADRWAWKNT